MCFLKDVTPLSHALPSVLPHNSSRWQLESSVLLLCVGSYGGEKNIAFFLKGTFRLRYIDGLLEKVFSILARLHSSLSIVFIASFTDFQELD